MLLPLIVQCAQQSPAKVGTSAGLWRAARNRVGSSRAPAANLPRKDEAGCVPPYRELQDCEFRLGVAVVSQDATLSVWRYDKRWEDGRLCTPQMGGAGLARLLHFWT